MDQTQVFYSVALKCLFIIHIFAVIQTRLQLGSPMSNELVVWQPYFLFVVVHRLTSQLKPFPLGLSCSAHRRQPATLQIPKYLNFILHHLFYLIGLTIDGKLLSDGFAFR